MFNTPPPIFFPEKSVGKLYNMLTISNLKQVTIRQKPSGTANFRQKPTETDTFRQKPTPSDNC